MTAAPFPGLPLDVQAEMWLNNNWVDISSDVRNSNPFNITRGVTDESTSSVASQCQFQANNRTGNYDPGNPLGAYYGSIGRGTPFRLGVRTGRDQFARTVSNGWGNADTGGAWATFGAGGTLNASDYNVASGVGKHSVPAAGALRSTYLSASNYTDVDVAVTCSVLPSINVVGGPIYFANLMLRYDGSNFYFLRAAIQPTAQQVTLGVQITPGGNGFTALADTPIPGVTHVGNNQLRVRAMIEGQVVRGKVWDTSGPEPMDWQITANLFPHIFLLNNPGFVGVMSAVDATNTNTLPVQFSYSDVEIRVPRYSGQIASIVPTASDISGKDQYSQITVAGALRRITGSTAQLQSALRRSVPSLGSQLVGYWPMEDGSQATSMATGLQFGAPMSFNGTPSLASYSGFACSAPLPTMAATGTQSVFTAEAPPQNPTGNWQVRCLINAANATAGSTIMRVSTTGVIAFWDVIWASGGNLEVKGYYYDGSVVFDQTIGFALPANYTFRISLQATLSGSQTTWTLSTLQVGLGNAAGYFTQTTTSGYYATSVTAVSLNPFAQCGGWAFGHLTIETATSDIFTLATQLNAYVGEPADVRFLRLCSENGIVGDVAGDYNADPPLMGAQLVNTLSALLQECADADRGIIFEPRGEYNGLSYKSLGAHYNQTVTLALNTATNDLGAYPKATYDDQTTHNTISVQRPSGSSVTVQQTTGPLAVSAVNTIGAQQVQANVQSDGQLNDLSTWILHLGTVTDPRYPPLLVNLLRPGNSALMIPAASVDVDDRITIAGLAPDLTSLLGRGYNEQLGGWVWTLTYNLAPESPYEIFTLDDTVLGRLDSDATTLHTGIAAGTTSFTVDVSDGTLWTTNSGDWPVLIRMGGEVMSVGSISGTSSPQTFSSVTRAVNGVSKSHSAGEQVNVSHPVYVALGRP